MKRMSLCVLFQGNLLKIPPQATSHVMKQTLSPEWNESFHLTSAHPSVDAIDTGHAEDLMGEDLQMLLTVRTCTRTRIRTHMHSCTHGAIDTQLAEDLPGEDEHILLTACTRTRAFSCKGS